jgi:hypothetical protein
VLDKSAALGRYAQLQQHAQSQRLQTFKNAFSACMTGRKYTVM